MVSGSIVLYKSTPEVYSRAIDSFLASANSGRLVIVDASPDDAQREVIAARYPSELEAGHIQYIWFPENRGYGAAHNLAFGAVDRAAKYHLVLNPDVYFPPNVLPDLERYADSDQWIGMVMPRVTYPNGDLQYLCKLLPTPADLFVRRFLPIKRLRDNMNSRYELHSFGYSSPLDVPYLSGCFMFIRRDVFLEVGGFDERYFMYPEDLDLTRRIHASYKTMFYPFSTIIHAHARESYRSKRMMRIHLVNMFKYFSKWGWFIDPQRSIFNKQVLEQITNGNSSRSVLFQEPGSREHQQK